MKFEGKPNFFCIGAPRCGTSSFYSVCSAHPSIFVTREKEPRYFGTRCNCPLSGPGDEITEQYVSPNFQEYLKQFCGSDVYRVRADFSPDNLFYGEAAAVMIHRECPDAKILAILRDPITRIISGYNYMRRDSREKLSLERALVDEIRGARDGWDYMWRYFGASRYVEPIKTYTQYFPKMKVILFEDLIRQPKETLSEVARFLEIQAEGFEMSLPHLNRSGESRSMIARQLLKKNSTYSAAMRKVVKRILPTNVMDVMSSLLIREIDMPRSVVMPTVVFDYLKAEAERCMQTFFGDTLKSRWRATFGAKSTAVGDGTVEVAFLDQ